MIRVLRAADHKSMPWKNGGGVTTEIAVSPEGAGLDAFEWRVSMARVESDGPFSVFPGIDRTLTVLDGEGIILTVEGRIPLGLLDNSDPVSFPADAPTSCNLMKGPITDLNVMVRRGRFVAKAHRITLDEAAEFSAEADLTLMFCNTGSTAMSCGRQRFKLHPKDCLQTARQPKPLHFKPQPLVELVVVELRSVEA